MSDAKYIFPKFDRLQYFSSFLSHLQLAEAKHRFYFSNAIIVGSNFHLVVLFRLLGLKDSFQMETEYIFSPI